MKKLTIIIAALGLIAACNKQSDDLAVPQLNQGNSTDDLALSKSGQNNSTVVRRCARPFRATIYAAVNTNSTNPPTACSGNVPFAAPDFILNGSATHMGHLNAQLSRLHHVSCDLSSATMLLTTNVSVDLVAANGDVLHCSGNDVVNVANLLGGTGTTGPITGTWTITGGTGRFNGASGSFTINGQVDFVTNTFNCNCIGTIRY